MTDPTNNYGDFFNMDKKVSPEIMGAHRPTIAEVVDSLLMLTMQQPLFYTDEKLRMVVCAGILYSTQELAKAKEQGLVPAEITAGHAGFMLLLSDVMSMTYDKYAGKLERENFPHNREDYIEGIEREAEDRFGNNED